ncbi:MAG: dihydrodipicolinate reductase [Negativicutes bacterium]|nr:dihydrodipicolinate reductase [Negativicutes bacterium]
MKKIRVGLLGFGKTGKLVADEFLKDEAFSLSWVMRRSATDRHKYASRLLGHEFDAGKIITEEDLDENFCTVNPVDVLIDFSSSSNVNLYSRVAAKGTPIVSAISNYEPEDMLVLESFAKTAPVMYSPNITLGINVLMVAAQILQKITPHADIEIVEEHFRDKPEISGTAKKIARVLNLSDEKHINSIRVGGIVGRHEIIFGLPNQTIRLSHESISRAAFGQGAIFAAKALLGQPAGMYTMETIIAEMFRQNIPVY